jgi:hypothetical protein
MAVIAATGIIISIEYPGDDAKRWARLYDNRVHGLTVDEAGTTSPKPVIIGGFPLAATDTAPILSPQWAGFDDPAIIVENLWRGNVSDFFTWLATNNGAHRPLQARFVIDAGLVNGFDTWAGLHPDLTFDGEPPAP